MVPRLREVDLHLTNRCNLTCAHCSVDSGPGRTEWREVSFNHWRRVVDEAAALGARYCDLTGGEPILYPNVEKLVRRIAERGMRAQLQSNGILMRTERLRLLRDSGLATLVISVDGSETTHDRMRGRAGSYQAAVSSIRAAVGLGMTVRVTTVVGGDFDGLDVFLRTLEELGVAHLSINRFSPVTPKHFENYRPPDPIEWLRFTEALEEHSSRVSFPISYEVGYARPEDLSRFLGDETRCLIERRQWLLIRSDGEVFPCYHFIHSAPMSLGNVLHRSLEFLAGSENPAWHAYRGLGELPADCEGCSHANTCGGGCPSPGYLTLGSLAVKDIHCEVERGFLPVCPFVKSRAGHGQLTNIAPYYLLRKRSVSPVEMP